MEAIQRPTRLGRGGRKYIGPKAQAAVPDLYFDTVEKEATATAVDMSDVWREVIEAGMIATGRVPASATIAALVGGE
jgi:hypothetical protein